jgi:hypothetical protein
MCAQQLRPVAPARTFSGIFEADLTFLGLKGERPMSVPLFFAAALVAGTALSAHAKDNGQYANAPTHIRDWFKRLENQRTRMPCSEEADCARTEARIRGGGWEAKAPDGTWVVVPPESVVTNQGNPTGEPILCSYGSFTGPGWMIFCFVPGPDG